MLKVFGGVGVGVWWCVCGCVLHYTHTNTDTQINTNTHLSNRVLREPYSVGVVECWGVVVVVYE